MFIDHLTRVILKHKLYDDTWQLKPTYFFNFKILINEILIVHFLANKMLTRVPR
jgi:hypothetical protein